MKINLLFCMAIFFVFFNGCVSTQINELPMYGNLEKNREMLEADEEFIKSAIAKFGNRKTASREYSKIGWQYYYQHDLSIAMRRFNQAWLLDNENSEAFWGFGFVLKDKAQYAESLIMLEHAYGLNPNNITLAGDYALALAQEGRSYLMMKNSEADQILIKSEQIFKKATRNNPEHPLIYGQWAVALFYHRKYEEAWDKVCHAWEIGGEKDVDQSFVLALKRKMPCPCQN